MGRRRTAVFAMTTLLAIGGCASGPRSTRLTAGDYTYTVARTIQLLTESDWLRSRTADSPRVRVTVDKVTNLTTDLIPEPEQWMFVLSVWNSEPVKQFTRSRNVATQVRPERLEMIRRQFPDAGSDYSTPTHLMSAVFSTATRTGDVRGGVEHDRVEQYQMEYRITEVATGDLAWSGIVEFKRKARGNLID